MLVMIHTVVQDCRYTISLHVQATQSVTLKPTLHMQACKVGSSGMECVCIVAECITVFTAKFHDPSSKIDFDIHFP